MNTRVITAKSSFQGVEPSFQGVIRFFVLVFQDDMQRTSVKGYYLPNVEIKDQNIVINEENFFDQKIIK